MGKKIEISKKRYEELLKAEKKNKKLEKELEITGCILSEIGTVLNYKGHRVEISSSNKTTRAVVCFEAADGSPKEVSSLITKPANEITSYDLLSATFDAFMLQIFGRGDNVDRIVSTVKIFSETVASKIQKNLASEKENKCNCCNSCRDGCEKSDIFSYGVSIDYLPETDELEVTFPDDSTITSPLLSHTKEGIYAALFSAVTLHMTNELTTEYLSNEAESFYKKMSGELSPEENTVNEKEESETEPKAEVSESSDADNSETSANTADEIIA